MGIVSMYYEACLILSLSKSKYVVEEGKFEIVFFLFAIASLCIHQEYTKQLCSAFFLDLYHISLLLAKFIILGKQESSILLSFDSFQSNGINLNIQNRCPHLLITLTQKFVCFKAPKDCVNLRYSFQFDMSRRFREKGR